jgi:hypothetical protein
MRPAGGRAGPPNPFNYLVRDQQLVVVVDWEQALISDPRSDVGQLVALSHLQGTAPFGPPGENPFVQLYEGSTGEALESMELHRARWLFQLGAVYHGWKALRHRTVVLLGADRGPPVSFHRRALTGPHQQARTTQRPAHRPGVPARDP